VRSARYTLFPYTTLFRSGVTTALRIDALARARSMPTSIHCAPALSAHAGAAMETLRHLEYFHDHVRIERMLFDGGADVGEGGVRSEEHTSELQSPDQLVC